MRKSRSLHWVHLVFLLQVSVVWAQPAGLSERDIVSPVQAKNGMVSAGEPLAVKAGLDVLKKGGNAVDAAVTVALVMAVTHPQAGNIGGGGFMLIYSAREKEVGAIDYREKAPLSADRDMFLDKQGRADPELSRFSHLSAGVPGTLAGLALALKEFGTLSLVEALAPAIELAVQGFPMSAALSESIRKHEQRLKKWASTREVFFKRDGSFYEPGDLFVQRGLAETLKAIAAQGVRAFYEGHIADKIVKEMEAHGGRITKKDLSGYHAVTRRPVHGSYRGVDLFSMPPPSSGGVHLVQILNILEGYDLRQSGHNSAETVHLMAEAMKRAYADRSEYLGDPDFVKVPVDGLISKKYAASQRKKISPVKARPSRDIRPGRPPQEESEETTHFSIVDGEGNAVSNTTTINFSFGSGIVVPGTGFLLNNEMDDFSAKPGVPNAYGLVGGRANAIEPGKRMLSSMSPTIILKQGRPFLITGSPGGSRIITTTLQVILNVIDHQMNIQEAVHAPRIHHQWLPDEIRVEEGLSPDTLKLLAGMGHTVTVKETMGAAASILVDPGSGVLCGASDPRESGMAAGY